MLADHTEAVKARADALREQDQLSAEAAADFASGRYTEIEKQKQRLKEAGLAAEQALDERIHQVQETKKAIDESKHELMASQLQDWEHRSQEALERRHESLEHVSASASLVEDRLMAAAARREAMAEEQAKIAQREQTAHEQREMKAQLKHQDYLDGKIEKARYLEKREF